MRNSSDLSCKFSKIGRQRVKDAQFERLILQVQQDRYSKGWEKERQIGDLRHIPPHTSRPVLGVRPARSLSPFSAPFHLTTTLRRVRRCILRTSERHDSQSKCRRRAPTRALVFSSLAERTVNTPLSARRFCSI